jgi:hypothetical protein
MPWLELGAQAAYWSAEQRAADVFIPALSLRFFASVAHSRRTELGLTGRAGLLNEYVSASGYEKTWHGSAFTAAGDVRTWLSSTAALQVSIELTRGSAYSHRDDGYSALNTSYASLGLRVGLVIAP